MFDQVTRLTHPGRGRSATGLRWKESMIGIFFADGETWIEVSGRDRGGVQVTGWVAEAFLAPYRQGYRTVAVKPEDTLSSIAHEYGVSLQDLEKLNANHIPDFDLLVPGTIIYLYPDKTRQAAE
jgi:hypothetical protein